MLKTPKVLLIFLFCLINITALSQRDTLFWFAAPEISSASGDSPIALLVNTYTQAATVTISMPANGSFIPIVVAVPANTAQSINLTAFLAQIESPAGNVVANNGLKITSTELISAAYQMDAATNKEDFTLIGSKGLGTNFYTPFQKFWNNLVTAPVSYSGIEIVATENATTVLITPRTNVTGHAQNVSYSVVLNAGQTYSARDVSAAGATSLAGSIVSANKPIAITLVDGALSNGACSDAIGDQITPTNALGNDHIIHKGTGSSDRVYILATQNSTALTITGSSVINTLINWGETYELPITDERTYISSTKPIYVYHVSGFSCELSATQVPSINCKGNNESFFTRTTSDSMGVVLITRDGFEDDFIVNGSNSLISPAAFSIVPGTGGVYKSARIFFSMLDVPIGSSNRIENPNDIFTMAQIGGQNNAGASYRFVTDYSASAYSSAGLNDSTCANVSFPLSGFVGGGAITGSWSSNGYGTFLNGINSVPNTYVPSQLDTLVSPIRLILTIGGSCPVFRDTMFLEVTPAPIVNANIDQSVCKNNALVQLNGVVSGGSTQGIWTTLGTGTFSPSATNLTAIYIPSSADLIAGSLTFTLTSTINGACGSNSDIMVVTFTNAAIVDAGADTLTVCGNNSLVTLSGTVSGSSITGKWLSSGNGIFQPNTSALNATYLPSSADTSAGFVWIYLESTSNGNCIPVQDSIYIEITNAPSVNAGINLIRCTNNSLVQLGGTVSGASSSGIWSGGLGTFSPSNTTLNATYQATATEIASGSIVLTLTASNIGTCIGVADVMQINFVAPPFANFNVINVCEGSTTVFTDFSIPGSGTVSSWSWNFGDLQTDITQSPTHTYAQNGTFAVQLIVSNSQGCLDTITQNALVRDKPTANFNYTASCPNNQVIISFTDSSFSSDPINYWFYDFDGLATTAQQNASQPFLNAGLYDVTHIVRTTFGCSDTIVIQLEVDPLPEAGFFFNSLGGLNVGSVFNFIDTSNYAVNWSWNFGDNNSSTLQNPSNTYFLNGNYIVTLLIQNQLGCVDSTSRNIVINTITTKIDQLIPTIISPNGDDLNDEWKLPFIELLFPTAEIQIYNEWGQKLFQSTGYSVPWDGTYNGEPVSNGNYFYIIDLKNDLETSVFKGVLMVLRKGD